MKTLQRHFSRERWLAVAGGLAAVTIVAAVRPLSSATWVAPGFLFALVTVSAVACVLAATVVIAIADRRDAAEMGLLGTMLMASSVMPLVHGLTTPDVLFEATETFALSAFLTIPVAIAAGAPLLAPHSRFGRWASQRWRDWTLLALLGVFVLASALVFFPDAITAPATDAPITIAVAVLSALAVAALSARQMRLFEIGRRPGNLVASVSLALIGVMALTPLVATPYSPLFWWVHVAGAIGVLGACVALVATRCLSPAATDVLAPILTRDPLVAFELGLSPIVHDFIAQVERKDETTRDHIIRTGELAMRVGERFRLSGSELRDLGLAAMLHDVGKVRVPDGVLKKPARLSDAEWDVMRRHPADGESMLAADPTLANAARIVRSHHERWDGGGYPDGLAGRDIPLGSRIIAACDAFDAMTNDRPYRNAMSIGMAFAILREHAGSQWDEHVVDQVISVVPTMPMVASFDAVGRADLVVSAEVPDDIAELLLAVDAEI